MRINYLVQTLFSTAQPWTELVYFG